MHLPSTAAKKPRIAKPADPPPEQRWSFSFRFFVQLNPYFGLSETDPAWFASLLERLGGLSNEAVHQLWSKKHEDNGLRFHEIDWMKKNVPIQPSDLTWIPADFRDNPEDYPFMQLMISTDRGRVVGFFDNEWVFNVVLLDRLHNLQPAGGKYGHRLRPTTKVASHHTALLSRMKDLQKLGCEHDGCPFPAAVKDATDGVLSKNLLFLQLDDDELKMLDDIIEAHNLEGAQDLLMRNIMLM